MKQIKNSLILGSLLIGLMGVAYGLNSTNLTDTDKKECTHEAGKVCDKKDGSCDKHSKSGASEDKSTCDKKADKSSCKMSKEMKSCKMKKTI
ncbi:MAG: hypothetical protein HN927_04000 [Candidatus Marinimicrobia bacterium]|jgi:hypothetical protein|nr:hypothetical protein [Candidatus Neomarinimicrobiota bacterium]MBT3947293.1 hypothetical protein [Candidatus Neomarinimicrobiota bacterium]MBT4063761.1 hypothetical protein [Candidatus Neomarinimicrobiota bacterium]MBT4307757.1 hypothetical protein [Candidatus Neomarinimicrobiota bacterium]MBT4453350.1 hypothetical protein [Candidatus Neomarinimicrobiota bacterium]|tara:strand:- start:608 stop:883 length:276 start_codon:yes stop_codon:yes gene_type:complete